MSASHGDEQAQADGVHRAYGNQLDFGHVDQQYLQLGALGSQDVDVCVGDIQEQDGTGPASGNYLDVGDVHEQLLQSRMSRQHDCLSSRRARAGWWCGACAWQPAGLWSQ